MCRSGTTEGTYGSVCSGMHGDGWATAQSAVCRSHPDARLAFAGKSVVRGGGVAMSRRLLRMFLTCMAGLGLGCGAVRAAGTRGLPPHYGTVALLGQPLESTPAQGNACFYPIVIGDRPGGQVRTDVVAPQCAQPSPDAGPQGLPPPSRRMSDAAVGETDRLWRLAMCHAAAGSGAYVARITAIESQPS